MKKHFIGFSAIILAVSLLAGCGGSTGQSSDATQSSKSTSQASSPASNSPSSQQTASSEQQSASEPSAPQESSGGAGMDIMGGMLADAYIDLLSGDTYYVKYRMGQEVEGEKMDTVVEMAVNSGDTAMITEMEGATTHMIFKENKMYMINHKDKTVMVMQAGPAQQQSGGGALPRSGFVFKGTGTGELFGTPRQYEEYGTDGGDVRFFFDGKKLAGFEFSAEAVTVQMEILEMIKDIPSGMFDIPGGYEKMEY